MGSGGVSRPQPLASPPLAREREESAHGSRNRQRGTRPKPSVTIRYVERVATEERSNEIPNFICEVLKEERAYRALAHKFLWEFFD